MILLTLTIVTAVLLWYALVGRGWLKSKPWSAGFFRIVEPIEIALYKKSETILFARLLSVLGGALTILTQLGEINLSPIIPFVPEKYQSLVTLLVNCLPLLITAMGAIVEWLRKRTTAPLELVAVPTTAPPDVKAAIAESEAAKADAVAVATAAKAAS